MPREAAPICVTCRTKRARRLVAWADPAFCTQRCAVMWAVYEMRERATWCGKPHVREHALKPASGPPQIVKSKGEPHGWTRDRDTDCGWCDVER